jgi:hypothetical protein
MNTILLPKKNRNDKKKNKKIVVRVLLATSVIA